MELLFPRDQILVRPATDFVEPKCESPSRLDDVIQFVSHLALAKGEAAISQYGLESTQLAADTVVVAYDGDRPIVLGKPPEDDHYERTLRHWWCNLLSHRPHHVVTAVCVHCSDGSIEQIVVTTEVEFVEITDSMADWYLNTGEPAGKAGGYAIQGQASVFVESIHGSFSNVVGLPLWETARLLEACGLPVQLTPSPARSASRLP